MTGGQTQKQLDPICGRRVEDSSEQPSAEYKRRRYFFCSEHCRHTFERQAERFRCHDLARAGALLTPGSVRWGLA